MVQKIDIRILILFIGLILLFDSCGSKYNEINDKKSEDYIFAMDHLQSSLTDTTLHNYVDKKKVIISDNDMAVSIAESILFDIYGKKRIKRQRPYNVFHIDNYWMISGTTKYEAGGTFMIILDSQDCRIIRLTHGK